MFKDLILFVWLEKLIWSWYKMKEYVNLDLDNIDDEHICCAIGDPKHQLGVEKKKEWMKNRLNEGHL